MKKGIYFSMDAFLASILLIGGLILISQMVMQEEPTETLDFLSKDLLTSLTELKVKEMTSSVIVDMITNGDIENTNNSLLEQIGEFWALDKTTEAQNFTSAILQELLPKRFGISLVMGSDEFFKQNNSLQQTNLVNSRRMVTGVKKGAALEGSTAAAYLERITQKKTSSFLYFGGFAGQGNITGYIRDIPNDVNGSDGDILHMEIEVDAEAPFNLTINGDKCGDFVPVTGNMTADRWNITSCGASIDSGVNEFRIDFPEGVNTGYIAGGFIKVTYETEQAREELLNGSGKYWLPGVAGVVNIYDSFFSPGQITEMSAYLHYIANHSLVNNTFYLSIGNETVYVDENSTDEQFIFLTDTVLSTILDYNFLSLSTVPIRVGFENFTFSTVFSGNADVMVITDVSGSMEWEFDSSSAGTRRNCDNPSLNTSSTTRLSVAKCLDKQFAGDIVNISGNQVGLVSYEDATHTGETVYPTTNLTLVNNTVGIASPESGYHADGSTCICCGINSAYDVLTEQIITNTHVDTGQLWLYNTTGFSGNPPPPDAQGDQWFEDDFDDSSWTTGTAVMGSNENGVGPTIVTDMGNSITQNALYPILWDMQADNGTIQVDFSSGLNYTGNTINESSGVNDDGWDSYYGYFGTAGTDVQMNTDPNEDGDQSDNTVATDGELSIFIGDNWDDDAPSTDEIPDSGAFGIELFISQEMYDMMNSLDGKATLYFDWRIDPTSLDSGEEGWIKAMFGTDGNMSYLGTNMDENGTQSDSTLDVFWCEDTGSSAPDPLHVCPNPGSDTFIWNLTSYINQSGWYYLVLGAKATEQSTDTTWDENWRFYFDNIYIEFSNRTDTYYLRKHFMITDSSTVKKGVINLMSDDKADIYVNGNLVHQDEVVNTPQYWNTRGITFTEDYLKQGYNVVAVKLTNSLSAAKFDLQLISLNSTRDLAMMVMTDGQANVQCARQSTGSSTQDAIQAACDAKEDYGITVYAVGFSDSAEASTLQGIVDCGEGLYKRSDDVAELEEFYKDVAQTIISASRQSQTVIVEEGFSESTLYPDSYISYEYITGVEEPGPNEITASFQIPQLGNCNPNININSNLRILDARVTSYSGAHWTDLVVANGNEAYNLSLHNPSYIRLGDPFIINIPPSMLVGGTNSLQLKTGDDMLNNTGCSANNSFIYTAAVNLSTPRSEVVEKSIGCTWTVEFESGKIQNFSVPMSYSGPNRCSYNSTIISYDTMDAYDVATHAILDQLDFDDDGRVFVDFSDQDLEVVVTLISQVPYLWGPAIAEVNMWN